MTNNERKQWIDNATYEELLKLWRHEPMGSPWFTLDIGDYFADKMFSKKDNLPVEQQVEISKRVCWDESNWVI